VDPHGCPQQGWVCRAIDLSPSGIGLHARRMIHTGRAVFVSLPLPGGHKKVVYGQVRYTRYESSGLYRVGVEFEKAPNTDGVRKWLSTQAA
jgi:hypothetical protein